MGCVSEVDSIIGLFYFISFCHVSFCFVFLKE